MNIGDKYNSRSYGEFEVLSINNSNSVVVLFVKTGFKTVATKDNIKHGRVKDNMLPSIYGVGFIGDGNHSSTDAAYSIWHGIIARCYSVVIKNNTHYEGCSVDSRWHNYQNFAEWYNQQEAPEGYEVDKDTLVNGNRIYSPELCVMISKTDNNAARVINPEKNKHGFVGVVSQEYKGKTYYGARVTVDGVRKRIGNFESPEEANKARLAYIKEISLGRLSQ